MPVAPSTARTGAFAALAALLVLGVLAFASSSCGKAVLPVSLTATREVHPCEQYAEAVAAFDNVSRRIVRDLGPQDVTAVVLRYEPVVADLYEMLPEGARGDVVPPYLGVAYLDFIIAVDFARRGDAEGALRELNAWRGAVLTASRALASAGCAG